jgi:hypothetical protein
MDETDLLFEHNLDVWGLIASASLATIIASRSSLEVTNSRVVLQKTDSPLPVKHLRRFRVATKYCGLLTCSFSTTVKNYILYIAFDVGFLVISRGDG